MHSETLFAGIAATGIKGYEPIINSPTEFQDLGARLEKHGLEMRSLYVNSTLHEAAEVEKSATRILAIAHEAKKLGTEIIVTNPAPIKWGGEEAKSDAQLEIQATALAYHSHDVEAGTPKTLSAQEAHTKSRRAFFG